MSNCNSDHHVFEPRFDSGLAAIPDLSQSLINEMKRWESSADTYEGMKLLVNNSDKSSKYIGDICVHCGHFIPRK